MNKHDAERLDMLNKVFDSKAIRRLHSRKLLLNLTGTDFPINKQSLLLKCKKNFEELEFIESRLTIYFNDDENYLFDCELVKAVLESNIQSCDTYIKIFESNDLDLNVLDAFDDLVNFQQYDIINIYISTLNTLNTNQFNKLIFNQLRHNTSRLIQSSLNLLQELEDNNIMLN